MNMLTQNSDYQRFDHEGIELVINTATGESFATQMGYARMSGLSQQAINKRCKGYNQSELKQAEIQSPGGLQGYNLIPAKTIFKWLIKDNPELAIAMGEVGANIYLHTLAGYNVTSTAIDTKPIKGLFERLKVILERTDVPKGYFIVGTEIQNFLSSVEDDYVWSEKEWFDLVDNSVGRCWSLHLGKVKSHWVNERKYVTYRSPIKPIEIWSYPYEALPEFRRWFDSVYELTKFPEYIKRKQKLGQLLPTPQLLLK